MYQSTAVYRHCLWIPLVERPSLPGPVGDWRPLVWPFVQVPDKYTTRDNGTPPLLPISSCCCQTRQWVHTGDVLLAKVAHVCKCVKNTVLVSPLDGLDGRSDGWLCDPRFGLLHSRRWNCPFILLAELRSYEQGWASYFLNYKKTFFVAIEEETHTFFRCWQSVDFAMQTLSQAPHVRPVASLLFHWIRS